MTSGEMESAERRVERSGAVENEWRMEERNALRGTGEGRERLRQLGERLNLSLRGSSGHNVVPGLLDPPIDAKLNDRRYLDPERTNCSTPPDSADR